MDGKSFDSPGADYTHQPKPGGGQWCTFEILVADFDLGVDPSLARLAAIVHAADIAADVSTDPLGPGLQAIGLGGLDTETDDQQLLASGMFIYDALSLTHKAITFDRRMPEVDYDSLDLPATGTLPIGIPGATRASGARNKQQPRQVTPRRTPRAQPPPGAAPETS